MRKLMMMVAMVAMMMLVAVPAAFAQEIEDSAIAANFAFVGQSNTTGDVEQDAEADDEGTATNTFTQANVAVIDQDATATVTPPAEDEE